MGRTRFRTIAWAAVLGSACGVGPEIHYMSEPYLSYRLGSPIVAPGCADDRDGDCLSDYGEAELADLAAPILFLDDEERCAGGTEFGVRPFFQVRPIATDRSVEEWSSEAIARIHITYFLNWPIDCGHRFEKYHLGDSEHVRYVLESTDLTTWSTVEASYWAHGTPRTVDGAHLDDMADAVGSLRPMIAVEGDKHGSWFGKDPDSDDCSRWSGLKSLGAIDCLQSGGLRRAFEENAYLTLDIDESRNIGEPPIEGGRFLTSAVIGESDSGVTRYRTVSQFDPSNLRLNQLRGTEYWWNAPRDFAPFCGWVCNDEDRTSNGACLPSSVELSNGETKSFGSSCAGPLEEKIDVSSSSFRRGVGRSS